MNSFVSKRQPTDEADSEKRRQTRRRRKRFFLILEIVTVAGAAAFYLFVLRPAERIDLENQVGPIPQYVLTNVPAPRWNGDYPCVYATASPTAKPQIGSCTTPVPMSTASRTPVDRFETDLRTGKFIMRQTDLSIAEAGFEIPLTRTYTANQSFRPNESHAFGVNANHQYDITPLGDRFPYTQQFLVLEDGDFLYFPRVSKGTSFTNAIYRQSEIGNSFYAAVQRWDGDGWKTELRDGSTLHFPEAYNARSSAQGAATEMTDAAGRKIELIRDRNRNLQEIRGPNGASIKLICEGQDRIVEASDGHGQWTKYTYNSLGFLRDAVHSDGTGRNYFYEDGLLTIVRDQQNRLLVQNSYQGNWLMQQKFGDGETIQYDYDLSSNKKYAKRVAVKFSNGSVKIIEIGDCVSEVYKGMK